MIDAMILGREAIRITPTATVSEDLARSRCFVKIPTVLEFCAVSCLEQSNVYQLTSLYKSYNVSFVIFNVPKKQNNVKLMM